MQLSPDKPGFKLPAVPDPPGRKCIQIEIPDEPAHIQAFLGAVFELTQWLSWQNDAAHTARLAAKTWKPIWQTLSLLTEGCTGMYSIRQNPTNPCLIDASTDGGTAWVPVVDISACISQTFPPTNPPGHGQPGGQTPPGQVIPPAHCYDIDVTIQGNQQFLIPYPITDAWTVEITSPTGAWNDGGHPSWSCYDGGTFFLGQCGLNTFQSSVGDPVPAAPHRATVLIFPGIPIAGVVLVRDTVYTIPNGQPIGNYFIQMNDSDLANNQGSVSFHLRVCSPAANPQCLPSTDFTASDGGYHVNDPAHSEWDAVTGYNSGGVYTPGSGWVSTAYGAAGYPPYQGGEIILDLPMAVGLNNGVDISVDVTRGVSAPLGPGETSNRKYNLGVSVYDAFGMAWYGVLSYSDTPTTDGPITHTALSVFNGLRDSGPGTKIGIYWNSWYQNPNPIILNNIIVICH